MIGGAPCRTFFTTTTRRLLFSLFPFQHSSDARLKHSHRFSKEEKTKVQRLQAGFLTLCFVASTLAADCLHDVLVKGNHDNYITWTPPPVRAATGPVKCLKQRPSRALFSSSSNLLLFFFHFFLFLFSLSCAPGSHRACRRPTGGLRLPFVHPSKAAAFCLSAAAASIHASHQPRPYISMR